MQRTTLYIPEIQGTLKEAKDFVNQLSTSTDEINQIGLYIAGKISDCLPANPSPPIPLMLYPFQLVCELPNLHIQSLDGDICSHRMV